MPLHSQLKDLVEHGELEARLVDNVWHGGGSQVVWLRRGVPLAPGPTPACLLSRPGHLGRCVRLVKGRGGDQLEPLSAGKCGGWARERGRISAKVVAVLVDRHADEVEMARCWSTSWS